MTRFRPPARKQSCDRVATRRTKRSAIGIGSVARAYVLAIALAVGGCSGSEIVQNWAPPASAPELAQPNHRRIVADNIKVIFPDQTLLGDVQFRACGRSITSKAPPG